MYTRIEHEQPTIWIRILHTQLFWLCLLCLIVTDLVKQKKDQCKKFKEGVIGEPAQPKTELLLPLARIA